MKMNEQDTKKDTGIKTSCEGPHGMMKNKMV
jgi:hypothetical protein